MESKRDVTNTTMADYARLINATYAAGTYRAGPMHMISLVGTRQEECGAYMPQLVDMLHESPVLRLLTPWSTLAITVSFLFHYTMHEYRHKPAHLEHRS